MLTEEEITRRLPVWDELASLFLDTDYIGIVGPQRIADRIKPSGYSPLEIERMLFNEVLPAFAFNLRDIAGEWAAWHPDFVRERMIEVQNWSAIRRRITSLGLRRYVARCWTQIAALL